MKKILLVAFLTLFTILIFILDMSDLFENKMVLSLKNLSFSNLNVLFWEIYAGFLLILITMIYMIFKNEKFKNELIKSNVKLLEQNLETQDQRLIIELYNSSNINEPTLWLKNIKKYDEKLKRYVQSNIYDISKASNFESLFKLFINDLNKVYRLYEDIELVSSNVKSEKEKAFFSNLEYIKKNNLENLSSPKYIVTKNIKYKGSNVKIIKILKEVKNQEAYEELVMRVREIYYTEFLKLVRKANNK